MDNPETLVIFSEMVLVATLNLPYRQSRGGCPVNGCSMKRNEHGMSTE